MHGLAKRFAFAALALLGLVVPYLLAEGVYSIARRTSLSAAVYRQWLGEPAGQDPSTQMITSVGEIKALLPLLKANAVGLGNSPFVELESEEAAINRTENGCLVQKPNLRKTMAYLRSNLFNPFDQLTYFHDATRQLPPELERFFVRYEVRRVHLTTNEHGERVTLPLVPAAAKILVAGDSVANGVMLDDSETLSSQLQARDPHHQYVNLGIARAKAADIVCALERAAARYRGEIRELIYVFCENDFSSSDPYGQPEDLIAWLARFRDREQIDRVLLLYVPYLYNVVPEVTRIPGHSQRDFPAYRDEKQRLLTLARQAGFAAIDFLAVANDQRQAVGSQFAPLALYVDHTHLSKLGVELLLPRLADHG